MGNSRLRASATMTAYDSVERGAADEIERRRPRTFTLTQLLVACVAVCVCAIAATKAVNTHRASEGVCDDHARAHADYVFLHEQLTTCGNKLAECAARCPLEGAARLSTSSNQLYINSVIHVNICTCVDINI